MKRITVVLAVLLWAVTGYAVARGQGYGGSTDTFQYALENNRTNQATTWVNPDAGGSGAVAPVRTFENAAGAPCREFIATIFIGGRQEQGYGTACRQPDGSWRIVSGRREATAAAPAVRERTTVYIHDAPPVYYYPYRYDEPMGYYYPSHAYPLSLSLSFGYVYRSGHHHHRHGGHRFRGHRR